ncbi:MAG: hypothetical protein ACXWJ6_10250 [Xanthobacteraceae bacterium]
MTAEITGSGEEARHWRRFVLVFALTFAVGLAAVLAFLVVVDPYDTGRFPTFMPTGSDDTQQNVNTASRGRNPDFNAAIVGNSHGQLIDPDRLSQLTGAKFIQLTTPGSGPREQLIVARYFLRHHKVVRALVMTFDQTWCTHDPALPALYNLPLWLFSESNVEYVAGLLNIRSIGAARRRFALALGKSTPVAPSGYWNYEIGKAWNFHPSPEDTRVVDPKATVNTNFPAIAALEKFLDALPPELQIVGIFPPQYYLLLPVANSPAARELEICKSEIQKRIVGRASGATIDDLVESAVSREPENFMDFDHYRGNVARTIEDRIAKSINGGAPAK